MKKLNLLDQLMKEISETKTSDIDTLLTKSPKPTEEIIGRMTVSEKQIFCLRDEKIKKLEKTKINSDKKQISCDITILNTLLDELVRKRLHGKIAFSSSRALDLASALANPDNVPVFGGLDAIAFRTGARIVNVNSKKRQQLIKRRLDH